MYVNRMVGELMDGWKNNELYKLIKTQPDTTCYFTQFLQQPHKSEELDSL